MNKYVEKLKLDLDTVDFNSLKGASLMLLLIYKNGYHFGGMYDYDYFRGKDLLNVDIPIIVELEQNGYIYERDLTYYKYETYFLSASGLYEIELRFNKENLYNLYNELKQINDDEILITNYIKDILYKYYSSEHYYKTDFVVEDLEIDFKKWLIDKEEILVLKRSLK